VVGKEQSPDVVWQRVSPQQVLEVVQGLDQRVKLGLQLLSLGTTVRKADLESLKTRPTFRVLRRREGHTVLLRAGPWGSHREDLAGRAHSKLASDRVRGQRRDGAHHGVADGLKLRCLGRSSQERGVLLDWDGVVGLEGLLLLSKPSLLQGSALVGVSLRATTADGMLLLLHGGPESAANGMLLLLHDGSESAKPRLTAELSPLCDVAAGK
jgi:hypothetical protein